MKELFAAVIDSNLALHSVVFSCWLTWGLQSATRQIIEYYSLYLQCTECLMDSFTWNNNGLGMGTILCQWNYNFMSIFTCRQFDW